MNDPSPKPVLFLQGSTGFGGSKVSLLAMIKGLRGTRYRPVVACPGPGWLTAQLDQLQVPYVSVPFYAWRKWLERPRVALSVRRLWLPLLDHWRFALVHSNEFWWAPHAALLASHLKIPAVVHLRDGHHTLKKARQYRLEKADRILAVATDLRIPFAANPELHDKTLVLFNGHEQMTFQGDRADARKIFGLKPDEFAIGNVGRISERKNQRLLIQALARLHQQNRVQNFRILLAGEADAAYLTSVKSDLQRFGLQQNVSILGLIKDMTPFFSAIDLLVHCALREGFPRVIAEAMLVKAPVISSSAEGVGDAIPNKSFGLVIPAADEESLAAAVEQLSTNLGLRQTIAEQAYERAQALFSVDAHRNNLLRVYNGLVAATEGEPR